MTIYWETGHFPCFACREGGMSQRLEFVLKREIITSEQVFPCGMDIKAHRFVLANHSYH